MEKTQDDNAEAVHSSAWVGGDEALQTEIAQIIKEWRAEIANCKTGERAAMATDPMFAARWNGKEIGMERCANDLERAVRRAHEGKPPTDGDMR